MTLLQRATISAGVVLCLVAATPGYAEESWRPELITAETEASIEKGLAFLARTQARDGSWRSSASYGTYPCSMTSLAGLALLAAGNTPYQGPYAVSVRRAVDYVLSCTSRTGLLARIGEEQRPMYSHGFAMLFLAQVYGMERDPVRQATIHRTLRRAIDLTSRSQSAAGGWLYTPDSNGDEGSVTITQIQALRACRNAGIKVAKSTIDRAVKYIAACANKDGGISYSLSSRGSSRPAITAAAIATLYNAGAYDDPMAIKALEYMKKQLKGGSSSRVFSGHYFYSMLYTSQAMWLSGEENWKGFFPKARDEVVKRQSDSGAWTGDSVGEVYGTALALLVLQLPYQYLPILQR